MDNDSVEMILGDLNNYKLPEKDRACFIELQRLLTKLDWDGMEALINN